MHGPGRSTAKPGKRLDFDFNDVVADEGEAKHTNNNRDAFKNTNQSYSMLNESSFAKGLTEVFNSPNGHRPINPKESLDLQYMKMKDAE